jgi:hypothetical protein
LILALSIALIMIDPYQLVSIAFMLTRRDRCTTEMGKVKLSQRIHAFDGMVMVERGRIV